MGALHGYRAPQRGFHTFTSAESSVRTNCVRGLHFQRRFPLPMSPLNRLERRLRQLVEGAFARVGGEGVQPIEIAQALSRELSERRLVGVSGAFVPNCFRVGLCPADWQRLEPFAEVIRAELEEFVSRQADEFGAQLAGPVQVDLGPGQSCQPVNLSSRAKPLRHRRRPDRLTATRVRFCESSPGRDEGSAFPFRQTAPHSAGTRNASCRSPSPAPLGGMPRSPRKAATSGCVTWAAQTAP